MIPSAVLEVWRNQTGFVNQPPKEVAGYNCMVEMDQKRECAVQLVKLAVPKLLDEVGRGHELADAVREWKEALVRQFGEVLAITPEATRVLQALAAFEGRPL
jgi:hypothetical protein